MAPTGEQLCYSDAYARSIVARVRGIEAGEPPLLVLDRTVFYPGGGGQPSDRGMLLRAADGRTWTVRAARKVGGEIVHELEPADGEPPAERRRASRSTSTGRAGYALMRTHTALHALCGVVWRDYGALVTGGNMEPGCGRMDFEFERMSRRPRRRDRGDGQRRAGGRARRAGQRPAARRGVRDPRPDPDQDQPAARGIEEIRTIEIVGLDLQADGGTHVANTREVGGIRVTGYESKGRINKRIRIELTDA